MLPLLILVAFQMPPTAFTTVVGQYATAVDRPRIGFYAQCASAVGALALMCPLVIEYGLSVR